jgi:hypothetical protein
MPHLVIAYVIGWVLTAIHFTMNLQLRFSDGFLLPIKKVEEI